MRRTGKAVALPANGTPWFGTQEALDKHNEVLINLAMMEPLELADLQSRKVEMFSRMANDRDQFADHYMIQTYADGKLATISIAGALLSHSLPLRLFGLNVTTYEEIQRAVMQVMADDRIEHVILQVESPGGSGNGLFRTSNLLEKAGQRKKFSTFTSVVMGSAGYWLGVNAPSIAAEPMAIVGSIGAYSVMISNAEAMQKEGIQAKVIRGGEFKALGHSAEPISEKAVAEWQRNIDANYDHFLTHASGKRGIEKETFRTTAAEGREFLAVDGLKVGLVDEVLVFDDYLENMLSTVSKSGAPAAPAAKPVKLEGTEMNKKMLALLEKAGVKLTDEQLAALQSGASFASIGLDAQLCVELEAAKLSGDDDDENGGGEGGDDPDKGAGGGEGGDDPDKGAGGDDPDKGAGGENKGQSPEFSTVMQQVLTLQGDKVKLDAQVVQLTGELTKLREGKANDEALITQLMAIAVTAVGRMEVAMRGTESEGLAGMTPAQLLTTYNATKDKFEKTFPVGRKSQGAVDTKLKGHERQDLDTIESAAQSATKI